MKYSNNAGLTLIEVILATAILSIGSVVLLTGATRCLGVMKLAREFQEAQWAMSMGDLEHPIVEIEEIEDLDVSAESYGDRFNYVREADEDEDEDHLYVVKTWVEWQNNDVKKREEVVRYIMHVDASRGIP